MAEQRRSRNTKALAPSKNNEQSKNMLDVTKPTSLSSLILWNISKALEKNPAMDIKSAIKAAQGRLDRERDVSAMIPDSPEQRHLACAVLAWQQLGHSDTDSLCMFIANKSKTHECASALPNNNSIPVEVSVNSSHKSKYSKDVHSMSFGSNSIGPVVKLPVETKIVMRMENSPSVRQTAKKPKAHEKDTMNKIEAACCIDSACAERLAKMDTATTELRMRAGMLAKREAERVELLERAEGAWRDLELGYQKRLTLTEEKEEDLTKQIQKAIEERNGYKNACTSLATQLREKGDKAEKDRAALSLVEKELCERACLRLKLSEESAQTDAVLAEHQCRAAQLERDLQFKEEQARRKLLNFQSELESSQTLTHETERAMRAELSALREQIAQVSGQLLGEDAQNARIRDELENLRQEKMEMVEDLEGCKTTCDGRMQGKIDELKKKRDQLTALKDKVMECRCKLPVDATVEVKRTASLAALCHCTPEEKILESCSCTSLRSRLLSNLLGDLFSGLQSEMGGTGTQMPCQLLKCLEDRHNWDRASIVKTNLKDYFAQLLIGELDIAIATSIEKYHAKWVGKSCADAARMIPDPGEVENEGWQERAIERRAQKLATKLAEQLFQERADQLTQQAKDIVSSGPPPCECKPQKACGKEGAAAAYPVLVRPMLMSTAPVNGPTTPANTPAYWRQTMQDVTQLRVQIEDLKKDSIKKEDLKLMEEKITKIVQRGSGTGKTDFRLDALVNTDAPKNDKKTNKAVNSNQSNYYMNLGRPTSLKKKQIEANSSHKKVPKPNNIQNNGSDKTFKAYKKPGQTYAINMCMCSQKDPNKLNIQNKISNDAIIDEKGRRDKDSIPQMTSSVKQTKPINSSLQSQDIISTLSNSKSSGKQACQSNCKCFHKIPSNTSIDKLLETLAKWKSDLNPCKTEKAFENEIPCCNFLPGSEISALNHKEYMQNKSPICCKKDVESKNTCVTSLDTVQKVSTVPDIEEESKVNSKISLRSSIIAENSEQIKICQSPGLDKSSIKNKSYALTPNEPNENKKLVSSITNEDTTGTPLKVLDYNSNNGNKKSNLGKDDCYDTETHPNNITSGYIAPTESEYMGAINLDKSNEDFCKCVTRNEATSNPPDDPYKCMPCKCSCKSLKKKNNVIQDSNEISANGPEKPNRDQKIVNDTEKKIPSNDEMVQNLRSKSDGNKKIKSEIFPCDCGYDITFLGVTLTDITSTNQIEPLYDEQENKLKEQCEKKCGGRNSTKQKLEKKVSSDRDENNKYGAWSQETNININNMDEGKKKSNEKVTEKSQLASDANTYHRASIETSNINNNELKDLNQDIISSKKGTTMHKSVDESKVKSEKFQLYENNNLKVESFKSTPFCECKVNFDEFKNYIDVAFQSQLTNEDKSLDVQSFKDNKIDEESYVYCDKQHLDESQDLEENTFRLLEEHLMIKLNEFKESSCNSTCIPPEEEEKLFGTILKRVKQVITESTNKITCKCENEEQTTKGSWNRAYGLLQEYLKTKIQRVQCACVLTEENNNNDTILPEVLGKVCNLIEHDFQRLKDVCGCKKLNLQDKDSKQVFLKEEVPERDNDFLNINNSIIDKKIYCYCTQNLQTSLVQEDNSSQVPAFLGMETKACNPLETYVKNVQTLECAQINSKTDILGCDCCEKKVDTELLGTIESKKLTESSNNNGSKLKPAQFSNVPYIAYASECVCKGIECTYNDVLKDTILNQMGRTADTELLGVIESKTKQLSNPVYLEKKNCQCDPNNSSSCCKKNENDKTTDTKSEHVAHFPNKPYIGYTIDCSCDTALGACICTKSIAQADNGVMDSIIKASLPNDKYYEKVSYIMKNNPLRDTNYYNDLTSEMTGDLYLHNFLKHKTLYEDDSKQDCETEASCYDREDIVLKNSREYFEVAHNTTNTIDDNISLTTDYSNTEAPLDWCECCLQIPPREINSDLLKQSLYLPVPSESNNHSKTDIKEDKNETVPMETIPKYCDCDLVPICHVKMLVENIETKLVSAKCTCDSMIPIVCPIHSTRF